MIKIQYKGVVVEVSDAKEAASLLQTLAGQKQSAPVVRENKKRVYRKKVNLWTPEEIEYLFQNRVVKPRHLARDPILSHHPKSSISVMRSSILNGRPIGNMGKKTWQQIEKLLNRNNIPRNVAIGHA